MIRTTSCGISYQLNNVITCIIKTKVFLPQTGIGDLSRIWLSSLDPLVFLLLKTVCNLLTLSVPDEGYSRNASRALNQISTFILQI
jgi:hypothetical protein